MSVFQKRSLETNFGNIYLTTLDKILKGDNINTPLALTIDENDWKIKHVPVLDLVPSAKPTMVIQCSRKHICCTPDHLVLTTEGYKRADKIKVGDRVVLSNLANTFVTGLIKELKVRPVYDVYLDGGTNHSCFQLIVKSAN